MVFFIVVIDHHFQEVDVLLDGAQDPLRHEFFRILQLSQNTLLASPWNVFSQFWLSMGGEKTPRKTEEGVEGSSRSCGSVRLRTARDGGRGKPSSGDGWKGADLLLFVV